MCPCPYEVLNSFYHGCISIDHANSSPEKIEELSRIIEQYFVIDNWGVDSLTKAYSVVKNRKSEQIYTDGTAWRIADNRGIRQIMTAEQMLDEIKNNNNCVMNVTASEIKKILGE